MSITDLEHESGLRPVGEYPDHCRRCRTEAARRERAAACGHEHVDQVHTMSGTVIRRWCCDCGTSLDESGD